MKKILKGFTEEINKIALNSNDDQRMKSIDWIETFISVISCFY